LKIISKNSPVNHNPVYKYVIWYNTGCTATLEHSNREIADKWAIGLVLDLIKNGQEISHITREEITKVSQEVKIVTD